MSRANTRELIGLAGIYRDVGSPCIYPDLMMRLRTADGMRPEFLEAVLRSPRTRRRIKSLAQGTSESMVKISAPAVERLLVPAPSLAAQDKFLSDRNALAGQIDVDLRELEKLRKVKQGLADDLLAGRDTQPRLG